MNRCITSPPHAGDVLWLVRGWFTRLEGRRNGAYAELITDDQIEQLIDISTMYGDQINHYRKQLEPIISQAPAAARASWENLISRQLI